MNRKLFITGLSLFILFAGSAKPAMAVSTPDFGSCVNPKISASQVNIGRDHGVIGHVNAYAGKDSIYKLSDGNVLQCLCPDNGKGIQTSWYKISGLSDTDINILKKQGWTYIITGSSWGLEDVPYLAKNNDYSCHGESQVLAATGNSIAIYGLVLAGVVSLIAGLLLKRFSK